MKPGIYDNLPMADYLSAPGISSSGLKHIARSPAHYREYVDNPPEETRALLIGSMLHCAVWEADKFRASYYVKPSTYETDKGETKDWHSGSKQCKAWLEEHADRPVLTQIEFCNIGGMVKSLLEHPSAAKALTALGVNERSLFWVDPITKMKARARYDRGAGNTILDLKKCQDASPRGFAKQIANYGYDIQAVHYLEGSKALELGHEHFVFIAVEEEAPHAVGVYELNLRSLNAGYGKYRRLMERYRQCVEKSEWPAYSANVEYLELPAYALKAEFEEILLEDQPVLPALEA